MLFKRRQNLLWLSFTAIPAMADTSQLNLDDMVVSASGFEQQTRFAPASITVISREDIERNRANSLTEILREVEGVDVGGAAGKTGGFNISMRGLPSDYTLILIDGRRQNVAGNVTPNGFNETQTSFIPPASAIERVEVIRGPVSTLYGSDAMGGVINIITRDVPDSWTHSLTAEQTLHQDSDFGDDRALSLYSAGPVVEDTVGLQLRGRVYDRDASELKYYDNNGDPLDVSQRGPSPVEAEVYTIGGKLTLTPLDAHDFWLDTEIARQRYDNSDGQLGTLGARGYGPEQRYDRRQFAVGHESRLGWGTWTSSLMHNKTETAGRLIPPGTPEEITGSDRQLENTNLVLDSKLVIPFSDHMLSIGGQWWDAEMLDGVAQERFEQTTWSVFAEDEWTLTDDLALTVGGRYDEHDAFGGQFSPRAYLVWTPLAEWTVKGGVSRGYKTPRLDQLAEGVVGFTGQGTVPQFGNPDLEPEITTSSEIAFIYNNNSGFNASATFFHNDFEDKIAGGPDQLNCTFADDPDRAGCVDRGNWPLADTFAQSINIDEAVTRGVELSTRLPLHEKWTLFANYTYTDSEQKTGIDKGEPLTDTPEHMVNARLAFDATDRLQSWLSAEYNSERYRNRQRVRGQPSYADLGDFKSFTVWNLGGRYQLTNSVTLNATVYNLFDKDFVDYRAYQTGNGVNYGNIYAHPQTGRRLWVSANVQF